MPPTAPPNADENSSAAAPSADASAGANGAQASAEAAVLAQPPAAFTGLTLGAPSKVAAGLTAVIKSMQFSWAEAGVSRGTRALLKLNQKDGFDCSSCAWPDPDEHRSVAEFCENGAKATASDTDQQAIGPEFFARHSVAELSRFTDRDLNRAGRITHPLVLRPGATHYAPIAWEEAFQFIGAELNALASPDEAVFYTSGKVPNEPAFLYQLFVREFGTNNLPDCSNLCHESSGTALSRTVGIGKGTVTLDDFAQAEVIIVMGQNPGTNHPRMLSALQEAKRNGAVVITVNPLLEAGLNHFRNPQDFLHPTRAMGALLGDGTPITDLWLQVRVNGDLAVLRGVMKHLLAAETLNPGQVLDQAFIQEHTTGYEALRAELDRTSWADIEEVSGVSRAQLLETANLIGPKKRLITCWAMGLTQQKNAVHSICEIVNLHLLKGAVGVPGAGLCPVRGHSNVQGDRTMGIWERPKPEFLDALAREFGFEPPRQPGYDSVEAAQAMHAGRVRAFVSLGGNYLSAMPDTEFVAAGLRKLSLTVFVAPKLNRGHLVTGRTALLLPCLVRPEIDRQRSGEQFTSCENSMGVVSMSRGVLPPLPGQMLSETAIVCGLALATLGERTRTDWVALTENYDRIRDHIARVVPGFEDFNRKVRQPGGFYLPNGPRQRRFTTENGKANFTVTELTKPALAPGQLVLFSLRSHDQFNTIVYDYNDRYRGVYGERRVIFLHPDDMLARGIRARQLVNITSHFQGQQRRAERFVAVPYDLPRGNCAAYFPEMNVLVLVGSVADESNQPTSKWVVVTVEPLAEVLPEGRKEAVAL